MGLIWDLENQKGEVESGFDYDPLTDEMTYGNRQDCEPILSGNKKLLNDGTDGYSPSREWRRAATIPNTLLLKWLQEEGIRWWDSDDAPKLMAKLDDPEYRHLRTAPGTLSRKPVRTYYKGSTG